MSDILLTIFTYHYGQNIDELLIFSGYDYYHNLLDGLFF